MEIERIGNLTVVMENPKSLFNYFGWPTVTRLQNGKLAVVASGFRVSHVCPFGKTVISYSEDEGETYTNPAPVIDTVLDDRDGGILAFGEKNVIVTSFNNTIDFQKWILEHSDEGNTGTRANDELKYAYFNRVSKEQEDEVLGPTFRVSNDCGVTFGELHRAPVTSPHGPCVLSDGSLLWVGSCFETENINSVEHKPIRAYKILPDYQMEFLGEIEKIQGHFSCEPYAVEACPGKVICHIRVQHGGLMTVFQSESYDQGKTWTTPHQLLADVEGAPAHILKCSNGMLLMTYCKKTVPYGICGRVSTDFGDSWSDAFSIYDNGGVSSDMGYPSTVELKDGSMATVFYAHTEPNMPARIFQQKWRLC